MKKNGYNRIKKIDIKKWLLGGNSKIYAIILILFLAVLLFVFKTIISMRNQVETDQLTEVTQEDSNQSNNGYIANNQKYLIRINKSQNFMTIYTLDSDMKFTVIYNAFWCATNSSLTAESTFITDKSVWYKLADGTYGHYANHLDNGAWIYSVPYYAQDISKLNVSLYNSLGKSSKTGSIYVEAGNAKWIYENCGNNTVVEIYENQTEKIPEMLTELTPLASGTMYDPSDRPISKDGVCPTPIDYMNVVNGKTIKVGDTFNVLDGASAYDVNGNNISSYIHISGIVDTSKAGIYQVYYIIEDAYGKELSYYREITVVE